MKRWVIKFTILVLCLIAFKAKSQNIVNVYVDPCDNKTYTILVPISSNQPGVLVMIRNKSKVFTYADFSSGVVDTWIKSIFSTPCPVSQQVASIIASTAAQAATSAAASAASSSAASAVSSTSVPTQSSTPSNTNSESKNTSSETKSESSSESKSESKTEEKKSESKKEEKKKQSNNNPTIFSADLSTAEQAPNRELVPTMNLGVSKSSMTGMSSFGVNSTIFLDLSKIAVGSSYTKNEMDSRGQLVALHNFGLTYFTDFNNHMVFPAYTFIQPIDRLIAGYNISANMAFIKGGSYNISPSIISFAMYPIMFGRKTITPDLFMIMSPISYVPNTGQQTRNRDLTFLTGFSTDFKIARKFKINTSFKIMLSTTQGSESIRSFMVGSKLNL